MIFNKTPHIEPGIDEFSKHFAAGLSQMVWTSIPADLTTPVAAMLRLMQNDEPCFLLESVEKGEIRGRYSVIGLMPDLIWKATGNKSEIKGSASSDYLPPSHNANDANDANDADNSNSGSLAEFRRIYEKSQMIMPPQLPPMAAGLVGYMAYDMVKLMEKLPDSRPDPLKIPDSCFIRPKITVIFDSVTDSIFIATAVWANDKSTKQSDDNNRANSLSAASLSAYEEAKQRIVEILSRLNSPLPKSSATENSVDKGSKRGNSDNNSVANLVNEADFTSNTSRAEYDQMITRAKEYINAGDIFQVVLSQRFSREFSLPPFALYRALRRLNPSPFLFYLHMRDFTLVGSSPEILVRLQDGEVTIRPIAGTRKRGKNKTEDASLAKELLADPKEISEHLMLLDLGRNDVGRVAKTGTVKTTQRMNIENYSHVMHIVSNVVGELNPKYDALSALIAGFPAGTVSGAPKIRAMEIIDELEKERRSFYGGCIGYFSANGNMDTAITLRTGLVKDGKLHIQAGGGIVAESNAEDEYQESLNKAKALIRAAEEAVNFL